MLPGFLFMFLLSWLYLVHGRSIPQFTPVFHGLQAAVGALNLLRAGIDDLPSLGMFVPVLAVLYIWKSKPAIPVVMICSGAAGMLLL
jgi:chromate transport protein ChrA